MQVDNTKFYKLLFGNLLDKKLDPFEQAKIKMLIFVLLGTSLILLFVQAYTFIFEIKTSFYLATASVLFFIILYIYFRCCKKLERTTQILLVISFIILTLLVFFETKIISIFNTTYFLPATVFTFFMLGKKWGAGVTIYSLLVVCIYVQFFLNKNLSSDTVFSPPMIWMGIIVILVSAFISALTLGSFLNIVRSVEGKINAKNKELHQSNSSLKAVLKSQELFIANTSHELRTPLNAINGFATLLSKEKLDSNQMESVNNILTGSHILSNIVSDILDYSKISSGKLQLHYEEVLLENILFDVLSLLSVQAKEKGLKLELSIDSSVPSCVYTDPKRLSQLLFNLVGNAVKFTPKGRVHLSVNSQKDQDQNIVTHFKIEDTGIGIDQDDLQNIFEAFNQVDSEMNRKNNGTGLGLAISKELVTLFGGTLSVSSKLNEGSVFCFQIVTKPIQSKPFSYKIETAEKSPLRKDLMSILIVDDNLLNQQLAYKILNRDLVNANLFFATSGIEAIDKARNKNFDIILMDIHMSGMDGVETAKKIKNELYLDCKIIAVTADVLIVEELSNSDSNFDSYLIKPYSDNHLLDLVIRQKELRDKEKKELEEQTLETINSLKLLANERISLEEIINSLVLDLDNALSGMEIAIANNDLVSFHFYFHSIKNNIQYLKFQELENWKIQIENKIKGEEKLEVPDIFEFESYWRKTKVALINCVSPNSIY